LKFEIIAAVYLTVSTVARLNGFVFSHTNWDILKSAIVCGGKDPEAASNLSEPAVMIYIPPDTSLPTPSG